MRWTRSSTRCWPPAHSSWCPRLRACSHSRANGCTSSSTPPTASIERFKAWLVAGGHRQRDGVDYTKVFAPVGKFDSLRSMLAITADQDLERQMVDIISNAFLNGVLETPVYMLQPEGYETGAPGTTCKLKKTLYGLKQTPKEWFQVLKKGLEAIGFKQRKSDQAFWVCISSTGISVYTLHWVDDLIMGCSDSAQLEEMKARILTRFKGRDLGSAAPTSTWSSSATGALARSRSPSCGMRRGFWRGST
jgi:hypothetical protein